MSMKATELHAAARRSLDGPLARLGFVRVSKTRTASWVREEGERWLYLWFQPHRWNGPGSAGFRFTVELRLASRPVLYAGGPFARLPKLLMSEDREALRHLENRTLERVPPPDPAYMRAWPEGMRSTLLADWRPRLRPYDPEEDVWFRSADSSDLAELLAFITRVLPAAIDRFLHSDKNGPRSTPIAPGSPTWQRLVTEFNDGPGARVWGAVQESSAYPNALDEALALWQESFGEWVVDRGAWLAPLSADELRVALGLGEEGRSP